MFRIGYNVLDLITYLMNLSVQHWGNKGLFFCSFYCQKFFSHVYLSSQPPPLCLVLPCVFCRFQSGRRCSLMSRSTSTTARSTPPRSSWWSARLCIRSDCKYSCCSTSVCLSYWSTNVCSCHVGVCLHYCFLFIPTDQKKYVCITTLNNEAF